MACDIQILSASGMRILPQTKASTVTVGGSAQECGQLNVTLSCGGKSITKTVNVGANGNWVHTFDTSTLTCTCGESMVVSAACVADPSCFEERGFDLQCTACPYVDDIAFIFHIEPFPNPLCVNGTTRVVVTLVAQGMAGNGKYVWDFDDKSQLEETSVPYIDHAFEFPDLSYNVKVSFTPAQPGCPESSVVRTLTVPDCRYVKPPRKPSRVVTGPEGIIGETDVHHQPPDHDVTDDPDIPPEDKKNETGGGRLSCDALLVAAILLMIAGGATIAIAICTMAGGYAILAGIVATVLGAGLFALWFAICGKITSCDVMRKMHWTLGMIILAGVPLGIIGAVIQLAGGPVQLGGFCWAAILGNLAAIGWLKDRLREIMEDANCTPTSLF